MPRGRLIYPFLADIARLDTAATAADPDGGGPLTSGYDPIFREPIKLPVLTDLSAPTSTDSRRESAVIQVRCQVEPESFEVLDALVNGRSPDSRFSLVIHYRDLERAALVDEATGEPRIRVGDRLVALRDKLGNLVRLIRNPPGLFVVEARDIGHGLGRHRNLLLLHFEERAQGIKA